MGKLKICFALCVGLLVFCLAARAEETKRAATISEARGKVEVRVAQKPWAPAQVGMALNQGDIIRTMAGSFAVLNVDGKGATATVEVKENSQMRLAELIEDKTKATQNTLLDLALGEVLIKAKKLDSEKSKFQVKTPTSIVGVRGTTFSVAVKAIE
jgi:hypothetical protein